MADVLQLYVSCTLLTELGDTPPSGLAHLDVPDVLKELWEHVQEPSRRHERETVPVL